ncbi:large ribosomal subunit protein eL14-like [Daphnia carinata]|uniref:large ribosomal subunit protein eL14-like n=1 Tax=Daphnia carinata TaxID=120202 RepID=UPI0025794800|nr:large ribosomal subunit protein eL14-like [Daphnia carinata]
MPFTKFVETGRVVYIAKGPDAGKIAAIIDIIDQNRALLDGPCSGVPRQARRFTELHLTSLVTKVTRGCSERSLRLAWEADKITEKWLATSWAKRIEKRTRRFSLNDLERFKLAKAKQARNKMIRTAFFAIRNKDTRTAKKARGRIEKLRAKSKAYGKAQKAEKKSKATKA